MCSAASYDKGTDEAGMPGKSTKGTWLFGVRGWGEARARWKAQRAWGRGCPGEVGGGGRVSIKGLVYCVDEARLFP